MKNIFKILYSILHRTTSNHSYIKEIDGLRFIAIMWVVLTHIYGYVGYHSMFYTPEIYGNIFLSSFFASGHLGVQLFFIVSGFILTTQIYNRKGFLNFDLKKFYFRRLRRLEPPYIISMIGLFIILVVLGKYAVKELIPHLAASLFYIHNLIYSKGSIINSLAWSLEIETQFYLLFPIYFLIRKTFNFDNLKFLLAILIIIAPFIQKCLMLSHLTLLGQYQFFLAGIFFAEILTNKKSKKLKSLNNNIFFDVIFFLSVILISYLHTNIFFITILVPTLFISALKSIHISRILKIPFVFIIGGMCYSIYLTHGYLITIFSRITSKFEIIGTPTGNLLLQCFILIPMILFTSTIYFLIFEKPFMSKKV